MFVQREHTAGLFIDIPYLVWYNMTLDLLLQHKRLTHQRRFGMVLL